MKESDKEIIEIIVSINELLNNSENTIIDKNRLNGIVSSYHYYESVQEQISSIFKRVIKNHVFIDANKRTALVTLNLFIDEYSLNTKLSDNEMYKLIQAIAAENLDVSIISEKIFKRKLN